MRAFALLIAAFSLLSILQRHGAEPALISRAEGSVSCPVEMARVGTFCIAPLVVQTIAAKRQLRLSPFYPPEPRLLGRLHAFSSGYASRVGTGRAPLLRPQPLPEHRLASFNAQAVSAPDVL